VAPGLRFWRGARRRQQTDWMISVRRVDFGYFIRPPEETGTGAARVEPVLGYVIDHPDGRLLVDTGMGAHPEVDEHYRPRRIPLARAVGDLGDVRYVVNCHLHFDHCGGNPLLAGRPVFTQRRELDSARRETDYTLPELIDAPGITYVELDGETEILPGVLIVPTPGHTAGHQSIVVHKKDGTVVVAGQSHDTASAYAAEALGHRAAVGEQPAWIARLAALDPRRVVFAHDNSVWEP
jgi:N-acyl homoserine lactone hydrolase